MDSPIVRSALIILTFPALIVYRHSIKSLRVKVLTQYWMRSFQPRVIFNSRENSTILQIAFLTVSLPLFFSGTLYLLYYHPTHFPFIFPVLTLLYFVRTLLIHPWDREKNTVRGFFSEAGPPQNLSKNDLKPFCSKLAVHSAFKNESSGKQECFFGLATLICLTIFLTESTFNLTATFCLTAIAVLNAFKMLNIPKTKTIIICGSLSFLGLLFEIFEITRAKSLLLELSLGFLLVSIYHYVGTSVGFIKRKRTKKKGSYGELIESENLKKIQFIRDVGLLKNNKNMYPMLNLSREFNNTPFIKFAELAFPVDYFLCLSTFLLHVVNH